MPIAKGCAARWRTRHGMDERFFVVFVWPDGDGFRCWTWRALDEHAQAQLAAAIDAAVHRPDVDELDDVRRVLRAECAGSIAGEQDEHGYIE